VVFAALAPNAINTAKFIVDEDVGPSVGASVGGSVFVGPAVGASVGGSTGFGVLSFKPPETLIKAVFVVGTLVGPGVGFSVGSAMAPDVIISSVSALVITGEAAGLAAVGEVGEAGEAADMVGEVGEAAVEVGEAAGATSGNSVEAVGDFDTTVDKAKYGAAVALIKDNGLAVTGALRPANVSAAMLVAAVPTTVESIVGALVGAL
jgi:hypothetical protein